MTRHPVPPRAARGFSLVELLIAVAIGLALLAGLSVMFVKNTRAQAEIEKAHRQVENGRYAIDLLTGDLRNAGYFAEFNPTVLASPAALPPVCATTVDELKAGLALAVQGVDGSSAGLACLNETVRAGTDVLVVRRTATCIAGQAGCESTAAGGPFFQASLCNNGTELDSADSANFYALSLGTAGLTRHGRNCSADGTSGTLAAIRRYLTHIYFVGNNNLAGDGIPTLKRAELASDGTTIRWNVVPLAEGIDNLQLEYGLDLAPAGGDGVADLTTANPAIAGGCAAAGCAVSNWRGAVAVRIHVLARNTVPSAGYVDRKSYVLGSRADGSGSHTIAAANDAYKRHVFQALVALPNPAGRRLP